MDSSVMECVYCSKPIAVVFDVTKDKIEIFKGCNCPLPFTSIVLDDFHRVLTESKEPEIHAVTVEDKVIEMVIPSELNSQDEEHLRKALETVYKSEIDFFFMKKQRNQ